MSYEDRKSTWNSGMRKAIRRGSAEEEVRKHRDRVTGAWKQTSKQRRRVDVRYDLSMKTALQHGTWKDEEGFEKTCIREKEKRGDVHQPFYGTWVADFMLRQDAGRFSEHCDMNNARRILSKGSKIFFSISVAFITGNSSLEPLLEGLCAQIHVNLSCRVFGRNRTGDLRMTTFLECRALHH